MLDGERRKSLSTIESLSAQLVKLKADRNTVLIALGGGVVGDVTGFLASIYMRGIRFVQIPTTFLCPGRFLGWRQNRSQLSGSARIWSAPSSSRNSCWWIRRCSATLPDREYRSGLYESLKAGVIQQPAHLRVHGEESRAGSGQASRLTGVADRRVGARQGRGGGQDEEEHGLRKILNFGHTIGHALEAETGYKVFLHGEAVAWGMVAAAMIAVGMQKNLTRNRATHHRPGAGLRTAAQGGCAPQGDLPPPRQ